MDACPASHRIASRCGAGCFKKLTILIKWLTELDQKPDLNRKLIFKARLSDII